MDSQRELEQILHQIHRRGYPACKETRGEYRFPFYTLSIDHVQGDPFASPSRLSLRLTGPQAAFPRELYETPCRRIVLQDELIRRFAAGARKESFRVKGSGHSGLIATSQCTQQVLERTACRIDPRTGEVLFRLEMGFPAFGRTVDGDGLRRMLFDQLPVLVKTSLLYNKEKDGAYFTSLAQLADDRQYIRDHLSEQGLCAFVANGSILPRASGVSDRTMEGAVPFLSPPEMEVCFALPHRGEIRGMGIKKGVTLIVGGGYHGKSTLLRALEDGVYDHIAGDGREFVITDPSAVKIRAEDGRSVWHTDISLFIRDLPTGRDTRCFTTRDASGSTSQAANVVEAMEAGAGVLLMDEDTSATNFLYRDELMQRVVSPGQEPIIPFLQRVRELYEKWGVSTILAAGSSGSFFHVAHQVVQMDRYMPRDITARAKEEAARFPLGLALAPKGKALESRRAPRPFAPFRGDRVKVRAMGREAVTVGKEEIDLRQVEQVADSEQCAALGYALLYAHRQLLDGRCSLQEAARRVEKIIEERGLEGLCQGSVPFLARPRLAEVLACLNRLRGMDR